MNKLSIGVKLAFGFTILLVMFIVVNWVTYHNTKKMNENYEWVEFTYQVLVQAEQIVSNLEIAESSQRSYVITGDESYIESFNTAITQLDENVAKVKEFTNYSNNEIQSRNIDKLTPLISERIAQMQQTIDIRKNSGFAEAKEMVMSGRGKKLINDIRAVISEFDTEEYRLLDERSTMSAKSTANTSRAIIWLTVIACIVVIILTMYLARIIAVPLRKLTATADKIASGNLSGKIEVISRKDEVGRLAKAFKVMQNSLRKQADYAKKIANGNLTVKVEPLSLNDEMGISFKTMAEQLRSQIAEISEGVSVLASSSSEIMASVSQLASSTSESSTSIGETTVTVEEVRQTAEVSNKKAQSVSDNAVENLNVAKDGTLAIENTLAGMNKIKQHMESIANMVVKLSEQSQTISHITESVNELAEQSNLLAVNAAIEAAKAGEHGKGFSVVAQEIKNLSERSKEATKQIQDILEDIQKSISKAVMVTEEGSKAVAEGLNLTSTAGETIDTLAKGVGEAADAAIQIAASSQQQLEGMDQITVAMENVKEASTQSAAGTRQAADSAKDLQKLGEKLKELVSRYKVE